MKIFPFFAVAFILSSCVTIPKSQWVHPANSKQQFVADSAICRATAVKEIPYNPPSQGTVINQTQTINTGWSNPYPNLGHLTQNNNNSRRNLELSMYSQAVQGARNDVFSGCMHQKGYYLQQIKQ